MEALKRTLILLFVAAVVLGILVHHAAQWRHETLARNLTLPSENLAQLPALPVAEPQAEEDASPAGRGRHSQERFCPLLGESARAVPRFVWKPSS